MSSIIMQAGVTGLLHSGTPSDLPPPLPSKPVCGLKIAPTLNAKKRKDDYRNVTVWPPFPKEDREEASARRSPFEPPKSYYVNQPAPLPPSRCDSLSVAEDQLYVNCNSSRPSPVVAAARGAQMPGYSNCYSGGSCFVTSSEQTSASYCGPRMSTALLRVPDVQVHHHFHHLVDQRLTFDSSPEASSRHKFTPPPNVPFPASVMAVPRPSVELSLGWERKLDYHTISKVLDENRKKLKSCGWFYEKLGAAESEELLKGTSPGTFLVRYSSDPRCLFSLSVQQGRVGGAGATTTANGEEEGRIKEGTGPTSSRIHFQNGKFHMDATDERILKYMPQFDSVVELVEHYVKCTSSSSSSSSSSAGARDAKNKNVWVDNDGNVYRIYLSRPLYRQPSKGESRPPSLFHLSRLAVHRAIGEWVSIPSTASKTPTLRRVQNLEAISKLNLPAGIKDNLRDYPHTI